MVASLANELQVPLTEADNTTNINQFGNNFYTLFKHINGVKMNGFYEHYTDIIARLGDAWNKFLNNNNQLLKQINLVIDMREKLKPIKKLSNQLLSEMPNNATFNSFEKKEYAIEVYIWRKLNPLLEQAAEAMKNEGIEPSEFY